MFAPLLPKILQLAIVLLLLLQSNFWSPAALAQSQTNDHPTPATTKQVTPDSPSQIQETNRDRPSQRQEQAQSDRQQTQANPPLHHYDRKAIKKFNEELYGN